MIEVDRFENTRVYIVRACVFTVSARSQSRDRINTWKFTVPRPSSTPNVLRPGPPAGGLLLLAISAYRKAQKPDTGEARGRVGGAVPKTRSNLHRQFMRQL